MLSTRKCRKFGHHTTAFQLDNAPRNTPSISNDRVVRAVSNHSFKEPSLPLSKMSKQYLAEHTIDDAHRIDIYSLAVTPTQIISASGESSLKIHSTKEADFPIAQVLKNAHKLGCHHVVTSRDGRRAVSVGFGGEAKIWRYDEGMWKDDGEIAEALKAGELWAVVLSAEGRYLAGTTYNGRINVWDLDDGKKQFMEYETKGSFGMSIDLVSS